MSSHPRPSEENRDEENKLRPKKKWINDRNFPVPRTICVLFPAKKKIKNKKQKIKNKKKNKKETVVVSQPLPKRVS